MYAFENISAGFGRARMPADNLLLRTCMEIAQRRQRLQEDALAHNGYIRDDQQNIKGLDNKLYGGEISLIAALFHKLQHDNNLYSHCSDLARQAATRAKRDPVIADLCATWDTLDLKQRLTGLCAVSRIMTNVISGSDKMLRLNYPMLALTKYPAAAHDTIAMEMRAFSRPGSKEASIYLLPINNHILAKSDLNSSLSMLWHEHQHIYMSALRDMLRDGLMARAHPLYKETYKSKTICEYRIVGNILLADDIYRAEPEEKLCYFTQDIFDKVFRYEPEPTFSL